MMRDSLSRIWSVASKELLDIVRDWRTLVALVLVPLLIFPLFFIALPLFLQGEMAELDQYELSLEVQLSDGDPLPNSLIQPFDDFNLNYSTSILDEGLSNLSVNGDDGLRIRNGQPQVILRLRETQTNSSESWDYAILYDATSELSSEGYYRVRSVIQIWESEIICL
ncbi:MAG TPA: hypothetical protein QF802_05530 [Candidatus Thalassarchaeaceae archaeon]|nr:hypothetical protein [Candidatus Thalassarchaeaceae archaeon]